MLQGIVENSIILIVDDNPANLRVLSESLIEGGFDVAVATDGESAIKQIEHNPPDLVLLDIQMPGIDGFETCYRLKSNPNTLDIPIIFMTALSDTDDKVRGLSIGAVDYITKPFQHEEVLARVRIHLHIRHLTKKLENQNSLLKHLTEDLEQKIEERSRELQQTQLQLFQQEKLSSVGQMVAGVAHEINNPINFIHGNLDPIQSYTQSLLDTIHLYHQQCPNPPDAIRKRIEDIDLEFIVQDLPKILTSMEIGTTRIKEIVLSLRNFSRLDEAEFKRVDLHEGLESTLMILHHRLRQKASLPEIKLTKEYGTLPLVRCSPGQLNQVFMNLLSNAIDTLEERDQHRRVEHIKTSPSAIHVHTKLLYPDQVLVRIADNGLGIAEKERQKIFDPFFTTKPVGKGTGLGLSISYQIIVEKHHGKLWCQSIPGQGTEFFIQLPI